MSKKWKRWLSAGMILSLCLILTGCGQGPINNNSTGIWDHLIVLNFSRALIMLSKLLGNNYGWGIIVFTIIIRLILMPFTAPQMIYSRKQSEIAPKFKAVEQKYSSKDTETMLKLFSARHRLYEKSDKRSLLGCLPVLLQIPIIFALFQAVLRTKVLRTGTFMGIQLSKSDPHLILPIVATALTIIEEIFMLKAQANNPGCVKTIAILAPFMVFYGATTVPSALVVYWIALYLCSAMQVFILGEPFKWQRRLQKKHDDKKKGVTKHEHKKG